MIDLAKEESKKEEMLFLMPHFLKNTTESWS